MSSVTFDTYENIKQLELDGFSEKQAQSIVRVIKKLNDTDISHLATKDELKTALAETKAEIIKWVVGIVLATGLTQTIAIIYTVLSILPKLH